MGSSCACPVGVPPILECANEGRHKTCPYNRPGGRPPILGCANEGRHKTCPYERSSTLLLNACLAARLDIGWRVCYHETCNDKGIMWLLSRWAEGSAP